MNNAHKLTLTLALGLFGVLICVTYGWMKEHEARAVVEAQQQIENKAQAQIAAQQEKNAEQLKDMLATLMVMKQSVQTPAQIVQALPQVLQMPAPIREVTPEQAKAAAAVPALPDAPQIGAGDLIIPKSDAKAFFDAQVDCKANSAKASSCAETIENQKAVMALKDVEIKQLNVALKGGTKWQRTKNFMKAAGIGAAVGAGVTAYLVVAK
jgi:hypothetical protein